MMNNVAGDGISSEAAIAVASSLSKLTRLHIGSQQPVSLDSSDLLMSGYLPIASKLPNLQSLNFGRRMC